MREMVSQAPKLLILSEQPSDPLCVHLKLANLRYGLYLYLGAWTARSTVLRRNMTSAQGAQWCL